MKRRTPNYPHFQRLLRKHLAGKSNEAEQFLIESWYQHFDQRSGAALPGLATEEEEKKTHDRIYSRALTRISSHYQYQYLWVRVAAIVLLISGVAMLLWSHLAEQQTATSVVYQTGPRELKKILLADRSIVWLNANSSIALNSEFGRQDRKLNLSGEARFEVEHDVNMPFLVQTPTLTIKVIGTGFNVSAYKGLRNIAVAVTHGRVQVSDSLHVLSILSTGQRLRYLVDSGRFDLDAFGDQASSWTSGTTVLEKADFEELQFSMRNIYGLKIRSSDPEVLNSKYNISLPSSLSPEQGLRLLMGIIDKQYRKKGENEIEIF